MAYYDEVIERNKRYLTNAQVNALVAASQEYNIQNAGNRAGALASAREQYDTGYRGLQNMGLAGAMSGAPTSGEVPRLQTQIQAPFDAYNNRLRQVENQRLNAMGGMMAEQTRQARAAAAAQQAAAKAAQEEAMRQAQLRAAAEIQTMKNDKSSVARVINNNRPSGAKGITSEDLNTIKRYDEPYTEPEKPATRAQTVQNTLAEGANQAFMANAQVIAAAKVLGISSPANKAVNKVEQSLSPILNQKTGVAHTDDERDIANNILQATKGNLSKGFDMDQAQKDLEAAQKKVDALASVRDTSARPGAEEAYQQAVQQRDVAKLKAEDPVTYSFLVVANSDLDAVTKKKAGQQFVDKAFTDDKEDAAQKFRSAQETVNRMEAELAKEQKEKEKASEDKKNMKEQVGTALYNLDAAKESGDTNKIHEARKALYAITDPNTGRGFDEQSARSWYWVGDTEEPKPDEDKYKYYKSMLDIIDSDRRTPEDKALLENAPDDFSESKAREYVSWFESETAPKQEPEKLRQAKETLAAAELRYKYPDAYKAMQIYQYRDLLKKSNPDIVEWADEKIADYRMQEMGLKAPAMTDEEYTAAKKDAKGIQNALRRIENAQSAYDNAGEAETEDVVSDKEHAKNDLDAAVREMQEKYGMTKEEAEAFMERFETEKDARMENDYYRPGMIALLEHQGETPTNAVNRDEIDQTYRMVNDLPWMAFDENEGSNYTSAVKWMTPEQKDAYNAIYEKDGIDAANQYFKDITPYLNIQRATADEAFYKEVADRWANKEDAEYAKENWYKDPVGALSRLMRGGILADLRSVGANLLWNAPATMERLLVGAENALGGSKYYDVNSDWSFRSGRADIIRSERSQNILSNMSRPEWVNNVLNFAYQTGMSMADSGVAMAFAYAGQEWMVDALFFSSAGNAAYKEAKERGATQQQAMEIGILSGAAEAIFEHASIEHFMRMDYKGKGALVKNLLSQATAEGSEEVSTEIANILTDVWVMRDKSQYAQAVKDYKSQGMSDEQAQNRAFMDQLASIGMAGFGGAVSGALFGLGGAAVSSVKFNKEGKRLNSNTQAKERVIQLAEIMGGKAQESLDVYNADKTDRNLGELSATVQQNMLDMFGKGKEAPDVSKDTALEMNAGSGKQVDLDAAVRDQIIDKATAYSAMLSGDRMSTATAKTIMDVLGKELLNDMGYNTSSSQKFASSYNQRLDQYGIQSRADAMAGFSFRQRGSYLSPMQQTPSVMGAVRAGSALTQAQERYTTTKDKADQVTRTEEATTRVWKDPNLGYVEREDGKLVLGLPGNMTSVPYEEQKKNKFAARITAKAGRATYAIAGMEALEGLSNEQKISELKKNMTKEALGKAEFLEQLAPAMKLDMVIHDDLGTADGYVDDNGVLHISLSSKKSILRVTSHELLHEIRQVSEEHYRAIKDAIIEQVGQEEFDKKVAQKAEEYRKAGVTLSQNGAEEETIAEYSERMLSDTDWLEDFVEKNPDAARTLGDVLLKIINAIKKAFKRIENRNYGTSWSQEIEYTQDTLQAMYDGLEAVMARKETKAEVSTDRRIADETKATERVTEQAAQAEADELYRSADDIRAEEAKKAAEESAKKKTYVPGFKTAEVERVLEAGVFGDKSNYEGDDYEQARAMIAQLIPDMVSLLKKEGDIDAVVEKTKAVVGKMLDNYFEDEGDMAALREAIPSVIGVDSTAKTDLKAQDTSLFQMSAKLSKALGHPVTLVSEQNAKGQKNAKYSSAEKLEEVWERVRDQFGLSDDQDFSIDTTKLLDFIEQQADTRKTFNDLYGKQRQDIIASTAVDILQAVKDMYSEKTGQRFSLDTEKLRDNGVRYSLADNRPSRITKGMSDEQRAKELRNSNIYLTIDTKSKENLTSDDYSSVVEKKLSAVKTSIKDIAGRLGLYAFDKNGKPTGVSYQTIDVPVELQFSRGSVKESLQANPDNVNKQTYLKVLANLDNLIKQAGLLDIRNDRYKGILYDEDRVDNVWTLISVLQDGSKGIPVKMDIKQAHKSNSGNLYFVLNYGDIEIGALITAEQSKEDVPQTAPAPVLNIAEIASLVNPDDGGILKYFPDSLLTEEQRAGKAQGLLDEKKHIRDKIVDAIRDVTDAKTKEWLKANLKKIEAEIKANENVMKAKSYSLYTDAAREARQAFTVIDTAGIEDGLEALKNIKNVGAFAMKDISRFLDAISHSSKDEEANKNLRNTLSAIFEKPHSEATGRYARGVERMQQRVLDIGAKAGVCDEKGGHFDSKKSAAIQNIGEGFSNTYTDLKLKVKDADRVTVRAYEPGTDKLVVSEKDYTLKELRQAYGTNVADFVWGRVFDETQKAQATGKESGWLDETVNTRPYTLADLQDAFPNDWQKLKTAADEFRQMYDEYIRDQNSMLRTIYPIASEYDSVEKVEKAIAKKQERLTRHKVGVEQQLQSLQRSLEAKEKEMAGKKRTDTKAFRNLVEQANRITDKIAAVKAEIAEYEANVNEELAVMNAEKAQMQNAVQSGESLKRMHRLQYRSDYFHHFQEMASGVQNLKAIFTNNTDISPAIVGRSENTKAKSRWAGYYQQRMGADYTADAMNGMLRYGQLAEYKLAFDPLVSYLRNVTEQIRTLDDNTNRDGLIKYLMAWTDNIAGKSHRLDRLISDAGMAPRKAMQVLNWINSRVIQNTLLFNMRSSLIQISNITNAKGIVTNNLDWFNGLRCWAAASKGNEAMQAIMAQSNFLASRYMDNMELTDSALKSAKKFAGWMLGALDEVSAKATWWAAYTQYQRNPNAKVIQNAYRTYDNAIDYADDVTRRTHAGRGVGELAPAMTSRVINFVAPFQVEINNTFEQFKDNVKRRNYLGLLSTGLSVFLFNAAFEAIVGSSPLQFDFIRAVLDIVLGFKNDDPDKDDDDYGLLQAWQRIAGEGIGSLPFAGQLVSIIGEDTAKKIFGEDNDATRYGNTQIGVSAVTNAGKGLYDIGKNLIEGKNVKQVNWISDLDDLVNLTLPMGGKQLTRSIQGLYTVAQGYGGKNDKEGKEQVQFVTDQDILHYIHAGLFGKWALTEASEYFGEERLLPKLFGEYEGPKSSIGKPVDANEYKAALAAGIDGKDYFSLKYDLKEYTTQAGKRSEMMEQSFTPEQKAKLDALLFGSKDAEMKTEGAVVYQKSGDDWKVKADYTNQDMFDLSQAGDKVYTGTLEAIDKTGLPQDQAVLAASIWDQAKEADDSKTEFRNLLRDNQNLTVAQKEALDLQYCGNKYPADYSDPDLYELSLDSNRSTYEKAKQAKSQGVSVKTFTGLNDKKKAYEGDGQATYMRGEIMKTNLSVKQKELLDDLLVSDKGSNPDYSSQAWFDVSMLGNGQYQEAKEGAKIGLTPETYLSVYNKWKTIDAKNENGKTVNGLKKKRAKEYLDSLTISAPVYDYIWTVVFGYKK